MTDYEITLTCECGNRDSIPVARPECSAECGRRMRPEYVIELQRLLSGAEAGYKVGAGRLTLNPLQLRFVASLLRVEKRKKERSLGRWHRYPGQSEEDALAAKQQIERKIAFINMTLARVREIFVEQEVEAQDATLSK